MIDDSLIGKTAQIIFEQKKFAHIKLNNGQFYNGDITHVGADFLLMIDREEGEKIIFFIEVENIEIYKLPDKKKEEMRDDRNNKNS
jgi:hypothetical protein